MIVLPPRDGNPYAQAGDQYPCAAPSFLDSEAPAHTPPGILATAEVRAMLERRAREKGWGTSWDEIQRVAARDFMPNPTGRIGEVEEVGALVAFLANWVYLLAMGR